MTPEQEVDSRKAVEKGRLSQSATDELAERFELFRKDVMKAWESTSVTETEIREQLYDSLGVAGRVQRYLANDIDRGKIAADRLKHAGIL